MLNSSSKCQVVNSDAGHKLTELLTGVFVFLYSPIQNGVVEAHFGCSFANNIFDRCWEERRRFFFPLLVSTVWHQQTRKHTLTVFNHRMETLLSLTIFVDSECSNLTFLMTPTPSFFFFALLKFCKTHLLFFGIFKTRNYFSETRGEFTAPHWCIHYKRASWKSWRFRSHRTCANTVSGKVKKTEWRQICT